MKLRTLLIPSALLLLACGGVGWWLTHPAAPATFKTATVSRQDVKKLVTATGSLRAQTMVDVGTQVSGLVASLEVDFNDEVKTGDLLARIDTSLLDADVASARARRSEAEAGLQRKRLELSRMQKLFDVDAATAQELEIARADAKVAEAQLRSAEVTLQRSSRNLEYATIRSPIDGIVVKRAVEVGQTVNAGFSAPTLFTLAGDLAKMQILARVDESDIGTLKEGGPVEFTVQSFPDRTFTGAIRQVRLESVVDQSVVTYTVVIDVENPEKVLLPGMTATVSFVVAEAKDVMCAPNAALRFRPDDTVKTSGMPEEKAEGKSGKRGRGPSVLWVQDGEGLRAIPVKSGIRGAECTEVSGEGVVEDLAVVTAIERDAAGGANPYAPASPTTGRWPGGF